MSRSWTNKEKLQELYWDEEMSQPEIADELNCSVKTISRWFSKHNMKTRDPGEIGKQVNQSLNNKECPWRNEEKLRQKYVEQNKGVRAIANEWGTSCETIRKWRDKYDIEPKTSNGYYGGGIPEGTQTKSERVDRYPRLGDSGVYVHQLVAIYKGYDSEKVFSSGEWHVHHKNDIPWDNRPENIELLNRSEHVGRHTVKSQ